MRTSSLPDSPVVVITGASSGIGRAMAAAFARRGARLVLAARDPTTLAPVVADCVRARAEATAVATDVTDAAAVYALAEAALDRHGGIDVWINNVGVGAVGRFDTVPMASHRRVVEANLLGHLHGAHAVLPHFRERSQGTLINMISIGGHVPSPFAAAYTASKFALRGFSEALRAELFDVPGVKVCEVYPTFVDTPGVAHGANHTGRRLKPPPPLLDPREVAATVVRLAYAPRRSVSIGSVAWPARLAHAVAPHLVARTTARLMSLALDRADPAPVTDGNLFQPSQGTEVHGGFRRPARAATAAGAGAVALGLLAGWCAWRAAHRYR